MIFFFDVNIRQYESTIQGFCRISRKILDDQEVFGQRCCCTIKYRYHDVLRHSSSTVWRNFNKNVYPYINQ